jgi:hypothetical protein
MEIVLSSGDSLKILNWLSSESYRSFN